MLLSSFLHFSFNANIEINHFYIVKKNFFLVSYALNSSQKPFTIKKKIQFLPVPQCLLIVAQLPQLVDHL